MYRQCYRPVEGLLIGRLDSRVIYRLTIDRRLVNRLLYGHVKRLLIHRLLIGWLRYRPVKGLILIDRLGNWPVKGLLVGRLCDRLVEGPVIHGLAYSRILVGRGGWRLVVRPAGCIACRLNSRLNSGLIHRLTIDRLIHRLLIGWLRYRPA